MKFDELRTQYPNLSDDAIADLASVSLRLSGNPKTRKGFLGLFKDADPNTPIPEIDTERAIDTRLASERAEREKFEQEQRSRWLQEDLSKTKTSVREKYALSDDDMSKMEKMMTDKQLPADYTWAAQLYKAQTETTAPTSYGSSGYGPLDLQKSASEMSGLMEDTDNWASRTAHNLIDDMHRKGRPSSF